MRVFGLRTSALTALSAALLLTGFSPAAAQSVDEIVSKHIDARGGYEKLKAIRTLKITRTFATPFTSVEVVTYKKRPDLLRIEQTPKGQTTAIPRGVNAGGAWDVSQGKVVMRPERVATEAREIDADFDGLLVDWKAKGHTVTLEGKEPIGGRDSYKLKVVTKGGSMRYVFIDAQTFLESGMSGRVLLPAMNPKTREPRFHESTWIFSDYREVDGVKFPYSIDEERVADQGVSITQSFAIYTTAIEVNVPMEDSLFAPPKGN